MRAGDIIDDRFEIEATAAAGGMGQVYRARDRQGGVPVAIRDALDRVERRAAMLPRPEWREGFVTMPEHRTIRELAARCTEQP